MCLVCLVCVCLYLSSSSASLGALERNRGVVGSPYGATTSSFAITGVDVSKSSAEIFFRKVKFWKGEEGEEAPPIFNVDGLNYLHVKHSGLLFVATTRVNPSLALVLELLQRIARVIKDYLGVLNEDFLGKNFVLVYELLDEMIDFGYPQTTLTEGLKSFVFNEPVVVDAARIPHWAQLPPRPTSLFYALRLPLCRPPPIPWVIPCFRPSPPAAASAASSLYDQRSCEAAVLEWSTAAKLALSRERHHLWQHGGKKTLDLLFFLHIPRTGGRTYHQCFLKNLYLPNERCPRSYDKLRLDLSQPGCKLLSTHDDMSILNKIPSRTSVVTNVRNPVDRVLSTYEFSVEVAARFLRLKSFNTSQSPPPRAKSPSQQQLVSTLTIWPWKHLVPFMQHDLFARRDVRREGKVDWPPSTNTTYDAPAMTMPLIEFIRHPVAHELVHNGATFQVAGLTNNSYEDGAMVIRKCINLYPKLGNEVLDVAKRRLDSMLFVGLTEKHQESATAFFSLVRDKFQVHTEALKGFLDQNTTVQEKDQQKLVLAAYKSCLASLRSSHAARRASTLHLISPVRFSQQERELIPLTVVDEIISLNNLDMDLYEHAKLLFAEQQKHFTTSTHPQVQEDRAFVLSMFSALCVTASILGLGIALVLRIRKRVGNDSRLPLRIRKRVGNDSRLPYWLRRLTFMPIHEKL